MVTLFAKRSQRSTKAIIHPRVHGSRSVNQKSSDTPVALNMAEINLEFLQGLMKEDFPDLTITEFEGAPGSKRGDNYTSMLYRISLKGYRHNPDSDPWQGSLIYKRLPESKQAREAFKSDELFCNEVAFYTKIWPAFRSFQNQWDGVKPFDSIPKCYLAKNDCVILKDLKPFGFVMPDRKLGLTTEECYVVMKHLSHFHALSLAMKFHNPEAFYELINDKDSITEVYFIEKNVDYYRDYYNECIKNAICMVQEELADHPDKDLYLGKLKQFGVEDSFFKMMVDVVKPREPLAVIGHGDCWTNNFLFRYAEGEIAEMFFVDFQTVRYASPALDLVYLMFLCLNRQQRREHQASLLEYYLDNLHARLEEMSEDDSVFHGAMSREKLREALLEEFKMCSQWGLGIALDMYPVMTCNSDEAPNVYQPEDGVDSQSEAVQPVRTNNLECRKKMKDLVQELVTEGLL